MTTKHTPGPWHYEKHNDGSITIAPENGFGIATMSGIYRGEDDKPNAALIAAAPELLDALKYVIDWHRDQNTANFRLALSNARAAIDKATGH
jgi:hypothetical protein